MAACVALMLTNGVSAELLETLAGLPTGNPGPIGLPDLVVEPANPAEAFAVKLAKRAWLLPVIIVAPVGLHDADAEVDADLLDQTQNDVDLKPVVQAHLPISLTDQATVIGFRTSDVVCEHVALVVGELKSVDVPLVRLHSECLTGDVLGSLRCDCGPQLQAALAQMAAQGAGVLLYLRQEGRGIGLTNKLRAYRLQESGLDTLDANSHLGFEEDERDFSSAAGMLRALGLSRIRLLTNNPAKVDSLVRHGIEVIQRLPLSIAANRHNLRYLRAKVQRAGHFEPPAVSDEDGE